MVTHRFQWVMSMKLQESCEFAEPMPRMPTRLKFLSNYRRSFRCPVTGKRGSGLAHKMSLVNLATHVIHVFMYACMYLCMHVCIYVCMFVCMYFYKIYVCAYECRHIRTNKRMNERTTACYAGKQCPLTHVC